MTEIDISTHLQNIVEEPSIALALLGLMRRRKEVIDEMIAAEEPVGTAEAKLRDLRKEYEKTMEELKPRMLQIETELNALMEKL